MGGTVPQSGQSKKHLKYFGDTSTTHATTYHRLSKNKANEFQNIWNFPHVVGCLDGKHIRTDCPTDFGAMVFIYKKYFSVFLQGLVDANSNFITVDMGGFGKQSDGGTFLASDLFSFIDGKKNKFSRT
jgi:hypothetical protein